MRFIFIFLASTCFLYTFCCAQPANKTVALGKPQSAPQLWVDSVYNSLTLEQKLGQLFMVAAYSGGEKANQEKIEQLITQNYIGGLIFMQGTAEAQAQQTNRFQQISKVPLLIGMDAEWGLGMRLKGVDDMPRQIMMGAMPDSFLVYKMAQAVAYQCKRMGVHINFAPVVDINNNPNNPVINFRSFGENKFQVAKYATQYVKGLQDNGVIASAKHFPGHGNTDVDSHLDLPVISSSARDLDNLELYPFKEMINQGVGSIMIAHLQVPSLEPALNTPTTLSAKVVTDLLKNKLSYKGLIITDALNMEGVAKHYAPGIVDVKAFLAGNDILLFSQDVATAVKQLKEALNKNNVSEGRVEESVKKILLAKYLVGLYQPKKIVAFNATNDCNKYTSELRTQIAMNAITLLSDKYNLLNKIKTNAVKKIAFIGFNATTNTAFIDELKNIGITQFFLADSIGINKIISDTKNYDALIVGLHNIALYPKNNFNIPNWQIQAINKLNENNNMLLTLFGNPYALKNFCNLSGVLCGYDDKPETQKVMATIIAGNNKAKGKLPVSVCEKFKAGAGITSLYDNLGLPNTYNGDRFVENRSTGSDQLEKGAKLKSAVDGFNVGNISTKIDAPVSVACCVSPLAVGANLEKLHKIDGLMEQAIASGAFPGCRVLIAKEGKVFYDKNFGYTTYDKLNKVTDNTLYDIASVTKVAATTLAVMKLYDQGKLNLDNYLGDYLPIVRNSNKQFLKIKDILLHQAGLKSWIPFYKETLDSTRQPKTEIYNTTANSTFNIKVANNLFMNKHWLDTMWQRIINSPLGSSTYEYSDLDFIFLQKVVEKITGTNLDAFVQKEFYEPLQLKNTCFNPLRKEKKLINIAPTESDTYFRYQNIQGYVHDMGAAMFGGVSGHAGLFSTPMDLAVILQVILNGGIYNGKRFFSEATVNKFTSYGSNKSRRGLGWDKPEQRANASTPTADNCSYNTFGHTGFTGTCVWADPIHNITFVFLSNRTFPTADNKLITKMDIRTKAQQYAYEALGIASKK